MWKHQIRERRQYRLGVALIVLSAILFFSAGVSVAGGGPRPGDPCPCGTNPPFICCGDLTCDRLSVNSSYIGGSQCRPAKDYYCCVNGSAGISTLESAGDLTIEFVERGNRTFDGLTNGVHVKMKVNGRIVPGPAGNGRYEDGFLVMQTGDRYLFLAGDLFLVSP